MQTQNDDFWAPRDTFITPITELWTVANFLDQAADALLRQEVETARELIISCDLPALNIYRSKIVEGETLDVHRYRPIQNAPPRMRTTKARMPSKKMAQDIFLRDGWRCRFCGIRILSLEAIKLLDSIFPNEVRWRAKPYRNRNSAFNVLASSLDHILPHSRGGDNSPQNLVAACGGCQFGRMQYTLEEVGFTDPRTRAPVIDSWDGLERLVRAKDRIL